jgi:hypothetical protein
MGSANQTYYPFGQLDTPSGIDFTRTAYPTSATQKPLNYSGWTADPTNSSALLLRGFRGKVRVNIIGTQTYPTAATVPATFSWLPVDATNPVNNHKL